MLTLDAIKTSQPIIPTKAVLEADAYRDARNKGREKLIAPDYSCVVYLYTDKKGEPCSIGYKGRAKKPAIHYRHGSQEQRETTVSEWMNSIMGSAKERKKPAARELEVGDVLVSSWGYEQTNIDYYVVTRLVGKQSVELAEIGKMRLDSTAFGGSCAPDKNNVVGAPFTKRANGKYVRISSFQGASKMEPVKVAGVEIYRAHEWTSYA